jgi:hypothetical protein
MHLQEITLHPELLTPGKQTSIKRYKMDNIYKWIQEHCSEFLQQANGRKLYRGTKNEKREVFLGYPRENRPTVERWSSDAAEIVNRLLTTAGFTARRDNSLFCNSSRSESSRWGRLYEIYPINGFTFGYSTLHTDVNALAYRRPYDIDDPNDKRLLQRTVAKEFVKDNGLKKTNLSWALDYHHDVWIHGAYVAIQVSYK